MNIQNAANFRDKVVTLLEQEKLPVDDLPESMENFFIAIEDGLLAGAAGVEIYGSYGLLRSVVTASEFRSSGVAGRLIKEIESFALAKNLRELYLLTETAPGYFAKRGYAKINRGEVPDEIRGSSEFSHVCPQSAVVMAKTLIQP